MLKRIARARHSEDVLSDVFRDTTMATPSAEITLRVGAEDRSINWPEEPIPDLQRILFYDSCGGAYTTTESDFPYGPSALVVMDGLITACEAIRRRADDRLAANEAKAEMLPEVDEEVLDTGVGRFLSNLSENSTLEALETLLDDPRRTVAPTTEEIRQDESRLRDADPRQEEARLKRHASRITAVREHFDEPC